jgi:hypothetical protein
MFGTGVAKILDRKDNRMKGGKQNDTRKMETNEKHDLDKRRDRQILQRLRYEF